MEKTKDLSKIQAKLIESYQCMSDEKLLEIKKELISNVLIIEDIMFERDTDDCGKN